MTVALLFSSQLVKVKSQTLPLLVGDSQALGLRQELLGLWAGADRLLYLAWKLADPSEEPLGGDADNLTHRQDGICRGRRNATIFNLRDIGEVKAKSFG
jgi:hypothetical protein